MCKIIPAQILPAKQASKARLYCLKTNLSILPSWPLTARYWVMHRNGAHPVPAPRHKREQRNNWHQTHNTRIPGNWSSCKQAADDKQGQQNVCMHIPYYLGPHIRPYTLFTGCSRQQSKAEWKSRILQVDVASCTALGTTLKRSGQYQEKRRCILQSFNKTSKNL